MRDLYQAFADSRRLNRQRGFTLIELLVVIAIIAILAAIAIPQFAKYKQSAYKNAVRSDIRNVISAVEAYVADRGVLPANFTCSGTTTAVGTVDLDGDNVADVTCSKEVTITYTQQTCSTGAAGYTISGTHSQISGWTASYDSCTGQYTNF